ncbi:MAG: Dipeptide transport system permease protein DppB [Chlamydiae bacterium]|nr:Dipeptide transport system permease protein DppB [Chlamydiota bacterium]
MFHYIVRRLILLPITLFFIIVVNFIIINMAPGEPTSVTEISPGGEARKEESGAGAFGADHRYLQFRERYGLTLPILFNLWPNISQKRVDESIWKLTEKKIPFKKLQDLRVRFGDQARFVMPKILNVMTGETLIDVKIVAMRYFVRGGTQQAHLGGNLTREQRLENRRISKQNQFLRDMLPSRFDSESTINEKIEKLNEWYKKNALKLGYEPGFWKKVKIFFIETRFFRYFSRVLTLDFGTLRDDPNKTVVSEVTSRFKYSLTLSLTPMIITFFLCLFFGLIMALRQNRPLDYSLNTIFLILYAIPIFVVAPFLIEEIALKYDFPFTHTPIPISGFTSPDKIYEQQTTLERLLDILKHIFLPIIAIMYGTLATQTRLARTAVLEVARQDYVRTAYAKGLPRSKIMSRYIGRNASITIVTSIAGSLGIILGGSLIVEILFEIDGFGKFFYDAVLNRDYSVIMFSAIAGSFLTLVGYLLADISYTLLDPRVTLE